MNQDLLDLLARLNDADNPLTDEELTALLDGLRARAEELRDEPRTDELVTELEQIRDGVTAVRSEQSTRAEAAAARDAAAQAALDAIAEGDDDQGDGDDADGDAAGDDAGDGEDGDDGDGEDATVTPIQPTADGDAPATGDQAPTAVAASARPAGARAPHDPRRRRPSATVTAPTATKTLVAAGGTEITDATSLGNAVLDRIRALVPGGPRQRVVTVRTDYPEDRLLRRGDLAGNDRKIRSITEPAAITASGGICGPLNVDYSVPVFAVDDRPVRDALPRFGADRGGITFTPPPTIGSVAAATGIWTEAMDAGSPGNSDTKAVLTVDCGDPTSIDVDAITTILQYGNMQGKFYPEYVAANSENAVAAAARVADVNLLNKIHALSVEQTLVPTVGAGRGLLEVIDQARAAIRYRLRLSDQARFRVIPPIWLLDMIRADLARELPSGTDRMGLADAQIEEYLAVRNVNASWHYDGVASQGSGNTYPLQGFAAASSGALTAWPTKVVFPIFVEGTFQFLDGGELNLGVVRDSTLDSTNDYQTFVETFENVAFRGIEALWIIATLAPTGGSAGTVTPANP